MERGITAKDKKNLFHILHFEVNKNGTGINKEFFNLPARSNEIMHSEHEIKVLTMKEKSKF